MVSFIPLYLFEKIPFFVWLFGMPHFKMRRLLPFFFHIVRRQKAKLSDSKVGYNSWKDGWKNTENWVLPFRVAGVSFKQYKPHIAFTP